MVRENSFVFSLNKLTGGNQIIVVAIQPYRAQIQISDSAPYAKGLTAQWQSQLAGVHPEFDPWVQHTHLRALPWGIYLKKNW
jgi:hypothetical protein